ncbi:MAG: TPM domain-containing protein [Selenomonadaceae bacterium]|nr:TPM domain-containing protein [Selenomonadaceae bacterium]MBR1860185.1 TPM domain-containing protein [Selenomonadaceae bacterium]
MNDYIKNKFFFAIFFLIFASVALLMLPLAEATKPAKTQLPEETQTTQPLSQSQSVAAVTDGASLLTQADLQQLASKIQRVEQKHGIQIGIVTQNTIQNQNPAAVADRLRSTAFTGGTNGNIVLLIVMDNREWHISTDSAMRSRITNEAGLPYVQDQFLSKLSSQDYAGALNSYVDSVDTLMTYYEQEGQPYDPSSGFSPMAAMTAVIVSIFIGIMFRSSLIASMSNVRPAIEASEYLVQNSVRLTENRDTLLFMNVQRQPKRKSSGGGGRSSGGSGGGGGRGGHF